MVRLYFLSLLVFLSHIVSAQGLVKSTPVAVPFFDTEADEQTILLPMSFDSHEWKSTVNNQLEGKQALIVSLVYTRFKTSPTFDQVELNRSRLTKLQTTLPSLFEDRRILWRLVEQTDGETQDEAKKLFHGFALNVRDLPTEASVKEELSLLARLKSELEKKDISASEIEAAVSGEEAELKATDKAGKKAYYYMEEGAYRTFDRPAAFVGGNDALHHYLASNLTYPQKSFDDGLEGTVNVKFSVMPDGKVEAVRATATVSAELDAEAVRVIRNSPKWLPAKFNGVPIESSYTIPIVFDIDGDGKAATGKTKSVSSKFIPFGKDRTVTAVLDRNPWGKMAIVCDLTGSMSPYTGQLLGWFREHINDPRIHSFTFFNDGDEMDDRSKAVGSTGGIYHTNSTDLDTVFSLIETCMTNGTGGDTPENNLEAAIEAQRDCPDCEIVLISDNFATPRDLKLYDQIKNKLHVVACGAQLGLNLNYLMLAYQSGGSLHTLGSDLNLDSIKEGEIVTVGSDDYQLNNGRFIRLF